MHLGQLGNKIFTISELQTIIGEARSIIAWQNLTEFLIDSFGGTGAGSQKKGTTQTEKFWQTFGNLVKICANDWRKAWLTYPSIFKPFFSWFRVVGIQKSAFEIQEPVPPLNNR